MKLYRLLSLVLLTVPCTSCSEVLCAVVCNNTAATIIVNTHSADLKYNRKTVIPPHGTVLTGQLSGHEFTVEKAGVTYAYAFPVVEVDYDRDHYFGRYKGCLALYLQFQPDSKIYILPPNEKLPVTKIPLQPSPFPLHSR